MKKIFHKIRYYLLLRFKYQIEKLPWKILNLQLETASGINLEIKTRADWQVYNEIFVKKDYDYAIEMSLNKMDNEKKVINFLDLGSNVGFFTLRLIDFLYQQPKFYEYSGILIEGSLPVYEELKYRINKQTKIASQLKIIHGLVGKRAGSAKIFQSGNSVTNTLKTNSLLRKKIYGTEVSYIDIETLFTDNITIDLLKCDIEGSEEEFIENYQPLLKKVNVAVFEMHYKKCDVSYCLNVINDCGLTNRKTIFNYMGDTSMEVFWR